MRYSLLVEEIWSRRNWKTGLQAAMVIAIPACKLRYNKPSWWKVI